MTDYFTDDLPLVCDWLFLLIIFTRLCLILKILNFRDKIKRASYKKCGEKKLIAKGYFSILNAQLGEK
jgi:hypothetical protein